MEQPLKHLAKEQPLVVACPIILRKLSYNANTDAWTSLWSCPIHILDFWMVGHASTEYFYARPDSTNLWWSIFAWLHQCQGAKSKEPLKRRASSAYHFLYTTVFSFDCPLSKENYQFYIRMTALVESTF